MGNINSIQGDCNLTTSLVGCADGVPYVMIIKEGCDCDSLFSYLNVDTGEISDVRPNNFEVGKC